MIKMPMIVVRFLAGLFLLLMAIYFADKYTEFTFFNISEIFPWKGLVVFAILVMLIAPSPKEMREYNRAKKGRGVSFSNSILKEEYPDFFQNLDDGELNLSYYPRDREFGINVLDGGTSFIIIKFCPWSGKKFPEPLGDEWFEQIEAMGIEDAFDQLAEYKPQGKAIPKEYLTEEWWIKQGL